MLILFEVVFRCVNRRIVAVTENLLFDYVDHALVKHGSLDCLGLASALFTVVLNAGYHRVRDRLVRRVWPFLGVFLFFSIRYCKLRHVF